MNLFSSYCTCKNVQYYIIIFFCYRTCYDRHASRSSGDGKREVVDQGAIDVDDGSADVQRGSAAGIRPPGHRRWPPSGQKSPVGLPALTTSSTTERQTPQALPSHPFDAIRRRQVPSSAADPDSTDFELAKRRDRAETNRRRDHVHFKGKWKFIT